MERNTNTALLDLIDEGSLLRKKEEAERALKLAQEAWHQLNSQIGGHDSGTNSKAESVPQALDQAGATTPRLPSSARSGRFSNHSTPRVPSTAPGKASNHKKSNLSASARICSNCEEDAATLWCDECEELLCPDCDGDIHHGRKLKQHVRTPATTAPEVFGSRRPSRMAAVQQKQKFPDICCICKANNPSVWSSQANGLLCSACNTKEKEAERRELKMYLKAAQLKWEEVQNALEQAEQANADTKSEEYANKQSNDETVDPAPEAPPELEHIEEDEAEAAPEEEYLELNGSSAKLNHTEEYNPSQEEAEQEGSEGMEPTHRSVSEPAIEDDQSPKEGTAFETEGAPNDMGSNGEADNVLATTYAAGSDYEAVEENKAAGHEHNYEEDYTDEEDEDDFNFGNEIPRSSPHAQKESNRTTFRQEKYEVEVSFSVKQSGDVDVTFSMEDGLQPQVPLEDEIDRQEHSEPTEDEEAPSAIEGNVNYVSQSTEGGMSNEEASETKPVAVSFQVKEEGQVEVDFKSHTSETTVGTNTTETKPVHVSFEVKEEGQVEVVFEDHTSETTLAVNIEEAEHDADEANHVEHTSAVEGVDLLVPSEGEPKESEEISKTAEEESEEAEPEPGREGESQVKPKTLILLDPLDHDPVTEQSPAHETETTSQVESTSIQLEEPTEQSTTPVSPSATAEPTTHDEQALNDRNSRESSLQPDESDLHLTVTTPAPHPESSSTKSRAKSSSSPATSPQVKVKTVPPPKIQALNPKEATVDPTPHSSPSTEDQDLKAETSGIHNDYEEDLELDELESELRAIETENQAEQVEDNYADDHSEPSDRADHDQSEEEYEEEEEENSQDSAAEIPGGFKRPSRLNTTYQALGSIKRKNSRSLKYSPSAPGLVPPSLLHLISS